MATFRVPWPLLQLEMDRHLPSKALGTPGQSTEWQSSQRREQNQRNYKESGEPQELHCTVLMAWPLKSVASRIDQRFEVEEEQLYRWHRWKALRLQTLISGLSLAVFWVPRCSIHVAPCEVRNHDIRKP
eukprot:Skav220069  [mRNA]  locus=scaffold262:28018:34282:+ [translate_table: standard]